MSGPAFSSPWNPAVIEHRARARRAQADQIEAAAVLDDGPVAKRSAGAGTDAVQRAR